MDKNSHIDKRIRDSFEHLNKPAPENAWENIASAIDNQMADNIDREVKKSFEAISKQAPDHLWNNINRQLYLDSTWKKIRVALNRRTTLRHIGQLAALTLLILLLGLTVYHLGKKMTKQPLALHKELKQPAFSSSSHEQYRAAEKTPREPTSQFHSLSGKNKKPFSSANGNKSASSNASTDQSYLINKPTQNISVTALSNTHASAIPYPHHINPMPLKLAKHISPVFESGKIMELFYKHAIPEIKRKKPGLFAFGITYSMNNTWLVNNETRRSFNQNSLISTSAFFTSSYGFTTNYHLSANNDLAMILYVNSNVGETYQTYTEGKYITKKVSFSYREIALLYQRTVETQKMHASKYIVKAGPFLSALHKGGIEQNGKFVSADKKYSGTDIGFMAQFGKEVPFGHFSLQYGLNAEKGLQNIFMGDGKTPADFNRTSTLEVGIYLNLKYNH